MLVGLCLLLAMSWLHAFSHSRTQAEGALPVGDVLHSWPREKNKNQSYTMQFSLRLLLFSDVMYAMSTYMPLDKYNINGVRKYAPPT